MAVLKAAAFSLTQIPEKRKPLPPLFMSVYTTAEIADKVRPIAKAYGIDKIYLFGSYARGEATEESDIDFYVEFSKPLGLKY